MLPHALNIVLGLGIVLMALGASIMGVMGKTVEGAMVATGILVAGIACWGVIELMKRQGHIGADSQ